MFSIYSGYANYKPGIFGLYDSTLIINTPMVTASECKGSDSLSRIVIYMCWIQICQMPTKLRLDIYQTYSLIGK